MTDETSTTLTLCRYRRSKGRALTALTRKEGGHQQRSSSTRWKILLDSLDVVCTRAIVRVSNEDDDSAFSHFEDVHKGQLVTIYIKQR